MDPDDQAQQTGLFRPAVGVAVVVGFVTLALGIGFVVRQAGPRPWSAAASAPPASQDLARAPQSVADVRPTDSITLSVAVRAATATPVVVTPRSQTTAAALVEPGRPAQDQTPRPFIVGTLLPPPRWTDVPTSTPQVSPRAAPTVTATTGIASDAGGTEIAQPVPDSAIDTLGESGGGPYTGLPVAVPTTAVLDGAELPVGPTGVRSDGARAFAQTLLGRARAQDAHLVEDPTLRQVAEQALMDELARAIPLGRVAPRRLRQGSVTVQIDVVATLPLTEGVSLGLFPSGLVPAMGVAAGVAGRVEPDYLPDLVAVAAVAYR